MTDEQEAVIQREKDFINEFKKLCTKYGYVDRLKLTGTEQSINIKVQSRIKNKGIINTLIKNGKDGIRNRIKIVGEIKTIIPEDSPEDRYDVLHLDISMNRVEEAIELVNRNTKKRKIDDIDVLD